MMEAILPNWQILIVQIVTFVIGMGAIWQLYIKSLRSHLKARREGIVKDLGAAETARQEAEYLRAQLQEDKARMADDLRKAREEAKAEVARLREDLMARAKADQEALLKQGRAQIAAETDAAIAAVRGYAAQLVVEATSKLIGKKLDAGADKAMAEKLVASVKVSKN
jgi:F-type H+-transporting ATPase subunit b